MKKQRNIDAPNITFTNKYKSWKLKAENQKSWVTAMDKRIRAMSRHTSQAVLKGQS